jgi:hypothetical protein
MNNDGGIFFLILIALIGFGTISHIGPNNGQHTGFVSSVEQSGIIWKTWRAYVKTDPQSSQEDSYCVTDPAVVSQLQNTEQSKESVTVNYSSPLFVWKWQCGGESAIVNSVQVSSLSSSQNNNTFDPTSIGAIPVNNSNPTPLAPQALYGGTIMQKGGIGSTTTDILVYDIKGNILFPSQNYFTVSWNTARDIMWVSCTNGHKINSFSSPSQNKTIRAGSTTQPVEVGIVIENKSVNSISLFCMPS